MNSPPLSGSFGDGTSTGVPRLCQAGLYSSAIHGLPETGVSALQVTIPHAKTKGSCPCAGMEGVGPATHWRPCESSSSPNPSARAYAK
jgi:hypothetical protein